MPMNILVPTDFSNPSHAAAKYATMLAKETGAKILLLHAPPRRDFLLERNHDSWINQANMDLKKLKADLIEQGLKPSDLQSKVVQQQPLWRAVEELADEQVINLVVMGTKGESNKPNIWVGINAFEIIEETQLPVIVVPERAKLAKPKSIVYASDLEDAPADVQRLISFVRLLGAHLYVLNVEEDDTAKDMNRSVLEWRLREDTLYNAISTHRVKEETVATGIEKFCKAKKADLVVMFRRRRGLFERILHQSVTKGISYQTKIPVMIFKQEPLQGFL